MQLKERTYLLLEAARPGDLPSRVLDVGIIVLILANVVAAVLETVPTIAAVHAPAFRTFERVSLALFGLEYAARLWSCTASSEHARPFVGRLRFALRPMMLIDLIAILPGMLFFVQLDLRMLRALRLLRVLRLGRYSTTMQVLADVLRQRAPELLSTLFVMMLLLTMVSSVMFYLEKDDNPAFDSIPTAMWWGIVTLTTVGYGDIAPVTPLGKVFGAIVAVLGIGMFAIPAGVLGAAFTERLSERRRGRP
ncbi:MAG: ion transporter [Planctomycetes bacterium]|nr:ion transporter [Planctomycetota bacterium]